MDHELRFFDDGSFSVNGYHLTDLPHGTSIHIENESDSSVDGEIPFNFNMVVVTIPQSNSRCCPECEATN